MKKKAKRERMIAIRFDEKSFSLLQKQAQKEKLPLSTMIRIKIEFMLDSIQEKRTA